MTVPSALRRRARLALMLALRHTPLPWTLKHRAIWLAQPKAVLVSVAVIPDSEGRVLMLRARYSPRWLLPGGVLEANEDPLSGVLRECREELGADITVESLTGIYTHPSSRETFFAFRCAALSGPPALSEEHESWRYRRPAELRPFPAMIVREALAGGNAPQIAPSPSIRPARASDGADD